MGLLIQDNDGSPAYALFTEENKVDKSNQIYNDLKEELKNIIKERLSGGNFDEFTDKLASLFGGNNRGFNNLFKGYSVASIGDITALAFKGRKDNYTLVAYRYKKIVMKRVLLLDIIRTEIVLLLVRLYLKWREMKELLIILLRKY